MNLRPRPRYLLVDLDGTLLDSQGAISARSRAVLGRAIEAGVTLVLASGRTYPSLMRVGGDLGLPFHLIANGGAVGLTPGLERVSYINFIPAPAWPAIVQALLAEKLCPVVFSHRHPEPPLFYVQSRSGHPHFEAYIGRHEANCRVAADLPSAEVADVVEVAALGSGENFERASARVMARMNGATRNHSMVLFLSRNYGKITEFFHAETSKWRAFLGMFPEAAAHPERVIAIGDEANDLDMIAGAGLGIAMGNATAELKAAADQMTADHDRDGLAEALEPLF